MAGHEMKQHLTVTTAPSTEAEKADPYFDYRPLVGGFNDHYDAYFYPSYAVCIDETMIHLYEWAYHICLIFHGNQKASGQRSKPYVTICVGFSFVWSFRSRRARWVCS